MSNINILSGALTIKHEKTENKFNASFLATNPQRSKTFHTHKLEYFLRDRYTQTGYGTLISYSDEKRVVWSEFHPITNAPFLKGRHYATLVHLRTVEKVVQECGFNSGTIEHVPDATSQDFQEFLKKIGVSVDEPTPFETYLTISRIHAKNHGLRD